MTNKKDHPQCSVKTTAGGVPTIPETRKDPSEEEPQRVPAAYSIPQSPPTRIREAEQGASEKPKSQEEVSGKQADKLSEEPYHEI